MSEEEKELLDGFFNKGWCCDLDEVYNAVMKLEDLYQKNIELYKELDKKDKIINEMADNIFNIIDYGTFIDDIENLQNEKCIIDYFTNKVDKEGR